jgi:hypothetical protein
MSSGARVPTLVADGNVGRARRTDRSGAISRHASSVADHPDKVLLERLARARPFSLLRYDRTVNLWDKYTDEDPSRFVKSCLRGIKGFRELAPLWRFLSCLFPRMTPEGGLRALLLREVFPEILASHYDQVWNQLRRRGLSGPEAEDLLQETFFALHNHILEHGFPDHLPAMLQVLTERLAGNREEWAAFEKAVGEYWAWLRARKRGGGRRE